MKIKAVCEQTGLTDRTIRYYIEEGLISPFYTENYLGRKNFDFSEADVAMLKDIAILRKFGFSIAEIKQLSQHPEEAVSIIQRLQARKQQDVDDELSMLSVLKQLDAEKTHTISELSDALATPVHPATLPDGDTKAGTKQALVSLTRSLLAGIIGFLPLIFLLINISDSMRTYRYPTVNLWSLIATILTLLPTAWIVILSKCKAKRPVKRSWQLTILAACGLYLRFSFVLSYSVLGHSQTTDIRNYCVLDSECPANRSDFYQELFPDWPHYFVNEKQKDGSFQTRYLNAHYCYRFFQGLDYTYDIYAQWPLEQDAFHQEVARVKALYENAAETDTFYQVLTLEQGPYTCFIRYCGGQPFQRVNASYTYFIFAYDSKNLIVRYILCDSLENGADQPYYLELDW